MKTKIFSLLSLVFPLSYVYAQNIGINSTGQTPNNSAVLDLNTGNSGNLGFLAPQVSLTATSIWNPPMTLGTATVGMIVYNTNTAVGNGAGYYYWGVNSKWNYMGVPTGVIVMWSGSSTSIPDGWALCDGTNGTPNLLGSFIQSVPVSPYTPAQINTTGGSNSVTLTVAQLPAHTFTGTTDPSTPALTFTGNASTQTFGGTFTGNASTQTFGFTGSSSSQTVTGSIEINVGDNAGVTAGLAYSPSNRALYTNNYSTTGVTLNGTWTPTGTVTGSAWTPTGSVTVTPAAWTPTGTITGGAHTHTFTTNSVGSGAAINTTPQYYTLAFIMKL